MTTTTNVTARATLPGGEVRDDIPVLNPGGWFGRTYLVEIGGSYWPLFLIVEADTVSDAIDELAEHPVYGQQIRVDAADIGDYPKGYRHYGPNGEVIDLDHVMVYGPEMRRDAGFPCRYFGEGCAADGTDPTRYGADDDDAPTDE